MHQRCGTQRSARNLGQIRQSPYLGEELVAPLGRQCFSTVSSNLILSIITVSATGLECWLLRCEVKIARSVYPQAYHETRQFPRHTGCPYFSLFSLLTTTFFTKRPWVHHRRPR
jgi:hypothetical protein